MAGQNREAVYWGVDPYPKGHEGFETPYPGWEQAHASDLGEADFNTIMKSARQWLTEGVLTDATEGMVPDVRFRAALDLALRSTGNGKYSVGLHPAQYNTLLARLAGVSGDGTLLTVREASGDSVYHPRRERTTMLASARIRQYASKFATNQPEVAFDLLDLASKVAEDEQGQGSKDQGQQDQGQKQAQEGQGQGQEKDQGQQAQQKQGGEMPPALKEHMEEKKKEEGSKDQGQQDQGQKQAYAQLKAATIRIAAENPSVRPALLPALKLIKQLG